MISRHLAPVVSITALDAPGHFVLTLDAPALARDARPGCFVAAITETGGERILRKPFSIFTADPESGLASLLFSVYGPTTQAMSRLLPGDTLDVLGPLGGRLFTPDVRPDVHHVLVGGGYGVPPLNFLARTLKQADAGARVTLVHGARSAAYLVGDDGLRERGVDVIACTDDGSRGVHGRVTAALEPLLDQSVALYTCGPTPMMAAVARLSLDRDIPCQVSMETYMPCGVGICVGCALALRDPSRGFARACTDGPVFFASEVAW